MKKAANYKKSLLPMALVMTLSVFVMATLSSTAQSSSGFTGTWKLDLSKSSTLPNITSETLVITQKGDEISFSRTLGVKDAKPISTTFSYNIGSRAEIKLKTGTDINISNWSKDKLSFSVTETIIIDNNGTRQESKRISTYSLADEGKKLTILSDDILLAGVPTPESQKHSKHVYTRG
ncbi:MAG TPA: hypothetical protein VMT63_11610 [Bacteroidales bacterium]|nr:hypothetical protein [Bacteroidales bacterium]